MHDEPAGWTVMCGTYCNTTRISVGKTRTCGLDRHAPLHIATYCNTQETRIDLGKTHDDRRIVSRDTQPVAWSLAARRRADASHGVQLEVVVQVLQRHKHGDFDASFENLLGQVLQQWDKAGDILLSTKKNKNESSVAEQ